MITIHGNGTHRPGRLNTVFLPQAVPQSQGAWATDLVGASLWGAAPDVGTADHAAVHLGFEPWPDLLRQGFDKELFYVLFLLVIWEGPFNFQQALF